MFFIATMAPRLSTGEVRHLQLSTTHAMASAGAILDVQPGMKPVTCAIDEFPDGKPPGVQTAPMGNFQPDVKKSPRHVLVVDDEPLIRWSVSESLSDMGCAVRQASDASSALQLVTTSEQPFDAVVVDLRLPDMNDLSLLGTLRQLIPAASIILMTAFGSPEILESARALGADVLSKPFEFAELHRLVLGPAPGAR
jgi:CheY-like chemotaxis protein